MTMDNPSPNIPIYKGDQDLFLKNFTHMHKQTQKLQNDQHFKKFQTHIFSSLHSILGMNINIIRIVHDC